MARPSVSVIVPSHKYGAVLEGCVRSVLEQEGVDVRVLIIDDCSPAPDATREVGQALAAADPRVVFRRHESNKGLIATANEGLDWADGEGVVLLSADDLLTPGALARAMRVLRDRPDVGMVYGHAPYWHEGAELPRTTGRWRGTRVWKGEDWIRRRCRCAHNCISSPEVVVRTSIQTVVGRYDPRCIHGSDLNMWLRVAAVSDVAFIRGAPQAVYRIRAAGMLRSSAGWITDLDERRKAFDTFFERCEAQLTDGAELRTRVNRALARQALWSACRAVDRNRLDGPDAVPVDDLVAFARDVYSEAGKLLEWRGLQARRRIGPGRSGYFPLFLGTGAKHKLEYHLQVRRRRWAGI